MSARELITEHLDLWTGAVTKKSSSGRGSNGKIELTGVQKLRELILQLAVEGKLVQHDSSHKPASELLQAAAAEKAQALKDKKIRKSQLGDPAPVTSESDVPEGWALTTLSAIGYWAIGNGFPKAHQGETGLEVLFCKVSDMNLPENGREIQTTVNSVSEQTAHSLKLNIHNSGTVIFPKIGGAISTNKRRVVIKPTAIDNNCLGITPTCAISPGYLYLFLTSVDMTQYQVGTSVPALSQGTLGKITIKLPPLEEQHRIVQKVNELMALCDRLEQQASDQLEAHETLVDSLLGTLTQSENATELADNWARLAAHFDTLFTTEQSIEKLKQTILQLAVMGRLVEQDAGDEPATVLMEQVSRRKAKVTSGGRVKEFPLVTDDEKPFPLPSGWLFKRLGDLAHVFAGNSFKSQDFNNLSGIRVIKITNVGVGELVETQDFLPLEFANEYSNYLVLAGDLILALTRPYISTGLKVAVCPKTYNQSLLNQRVAAIRPYLDRSFLYKYMQSEYVLGLYQARFGGSGLQPNLKMSDVTNLIIPVPPLAEQQRIVQKVDELMALCDHLKQRLNQASETRCQLAEAVVGGALH